MMNQIIRAENYRIRKNKTFRIACIVIIGMVLVGFALFYAATHMISGELMEAAGGYDTDVDAFTDINLFDCAGIAVSLMQILSILYAIVITIMIGAEKRNGVYSLMLERGYQTRQIYMAKLYATTVIAGIGYLFICNCIVDCRGDILAWNNRTRGCDRIYPSVSFNACYVCSFFLYLYGSCDECKKMQEWQLR